MASGPDFTERLVQEAFGALTSAGDAKAVQRVLARTAKALANALPPRDSLYDPDLDGPPLSPAAVKAAAIDARFFLELIADLIGDAADPDWMGDDFAFVGTLKKRPGWKPPRERTPAEDRRMMAAERVYQLMAEQSFDTVQPPQQEAAVAHVMDEFAMARSKVMKGLKEYRDHYSFLGTWSTPPAEDGTREPQTRREEMAWARWAPARRAMDREWFKRNPDAHFLGVPAGSAEEKELLSRTGPHDPPD